MRMAAIASSWRSPPDSAAVSRPSMSSIPACAATSRMRSRDLVARHAQVLRPEGELRLDRGPDDLLGRVLEDGPDGRRRYRGA